jgi:hypothetical protein
MRFFDCNCSFGESPHPPFRYARTPAELLEEMDFCGIDRALACHAGMRFGSPVVWNAQCVEGCASSSRLEPTWAILPAQTGEQLPTDDFLAAMIAHGVHALWAFPDEHRYLLNRRTFGELLDALAARRIPLFIKQNLVAIGGLLAECPGLTVVAVNQGPHSVERYLRPVMDAFSRVYVDTSSYIVQGTLEECCARYGSERLLFGTAFPNNCSGGAVLQLAHAAIPDKAKAAIAGLNLEQLLEEVEL